MEQVVDATSTCRVIRSADEYQGKQGPSYAGESALTASDRGQSGSAW